MTESRDANPWPDIPTAAWTETRDALHRWTQIVGKVRLARAPWLNHGWHATLYVTARGLTTGPVPAAGKSIELAFDFLDGVLTLRASDGAGADVALGPGSVADFHARVMAALERIGAATRINRRPNEIAGALPFDEDTAVRPYDGAAVLRFWRALVQVERVFQDFRTGFLGKCSPVHFFWGSFDLAVTRFSGRAAPPHPGGVPALPDAVTREAYSHEVSSAGFWPGGGGVDHPAFYSYAYPEPPGFRDARARPAAAAFEAGLGEFLLPYDAVRTAPAPDAALMDFLHSTYAAAADAAGWPRTALEVPTGRVGKPG